MGGDAGLRLLLDTHIWVWSVLEPHRLSRKVARALQSSSNEIWLSPISAWELVLLVEKQRIRLDTHIEAWLPRAHTGLREALLSHDVAAAATDVNVPHGDPIDRLLVATARVLHLTLVTADEKLIAAKQVPTLANR
jgi:PIN domain nuclease of toxin-antitoxin system